MRPMHISTALLVTLALAGAAGAQYAPQPILLDGDAVPGITTGLLDNVGRPSFNASGSYIVEGDGDATPLDECIIIDGVAVLFEGETITGSGGVLLTVDLFDTWRHINAAGDYVWDGTVTGPPTTGDGVLCRNDVVIAQEAQPSPIAGRNYAFFNSMSIDDAGNVYFEADLDGATADDEVLMIHSGGITEVIAMNVASTFREGTLIVGGPLDALTWELAPFSDMRVNGSGTILLEGNLDELNGVTVTTDDLIIRKSAGSDYELLIRAGDLITTPLTGSVAYELSNELSLAENGDWVSRAEVTTGGTLDDAVVIAGFGGAAPVVLAQESTDISTLTGVAGTTIGTINGVSINSNGQVLFLADILPTTAPWDEGLFLYEAGVVTLVMTDQVAVPSLAGAVCTGITADNIVIDNSGRYFFEGDVLVGGVTLDGIFEALIPPVIAMTGLDCDQAPATTSISATWTNSAVTIYDGIRVYVDAVLETTLAGTATSYTTGALSMLSSHTLELEPFIGPDSLTVSCSVFIVEPRDFTECRVPVPAPAIDSTLPPVVDIFTVATNVAILDLTLFLDITHTFQGDMEITIASPAGTSVMLTNNNGGGADNILATFADFGIPIGAGGTTLNTGQIVQPIGPGVMADFGCEQSGGDWTLTVDDTAGGDVGTLDEWCLNIYEEPNPALNCCPGPSDLACSDLGACGGPGVLLIWTNNFAYSLLQLSRSDGVNPPVTIPLSASATSYQDFAAAVGTTWTYTLEYRCTAGGALLDAAECTIAPTASFVPPVTALVCAADFCGGDVSLSWDTNGVAYTSLQLNRAGVFLADVTGLTSFVDLAPLAGTASYSVIASCGAATAPANCVVDFVLLGPTGLTCAVDPLLCNGSVAMTWTNNGTYSSITLLIDGLAPVVGPGPADSSFVTAPLPSGPHTLELIATCPAGSAPSVGCNVTVYTPPAGQSDCILALEGRESLDDPGVVDSVSALSAALVANGRSVYVTAPPTATNPDFTTQLPCGVDLTQFETIWVMTGTFPDDYRISAPEGDLLASLNRDNGIGIYFEASDHWYYTHTVSQFDNRDGVWTGGIDGDDTFTSMTALNSGNGLDPTVDFPTAVNYSQDQTGTDFTDRLVVSAVGQDPEIASAGSVWVNNNDGLPLATDPDELVPYVATVYAVNTVGAAVIASSFEFGGFALDPLNPAASDAARESLAALYLTALGRGGSTGPQLVRGNANNDASVNIADAIYLLGNLFPSGGSPNVLLCLDAADANDDALINIADAISLLTSLFGSPAVPLPFPNSDDGCAEDPGQELGCTQYDNCP